MAECVAILDAVEMALRSPSRKMLVLSDSKSVLEAVTSLGIVSNANYLTFRMKEKILSYVGKSIGRFHIELLWIPAHMGIRENEHVDGVAKMAACKEEDFSRVIPHTEVMHLGEPSITFARKAWLKALNMFRII